MDGIEMRGDGRAVLVVLTAAARTRKAAVDESHIGMTLHLEAHRVARTAADEVEVEVRQSHEMLTADLASLCHHRKSRSREIHFLQMVLCRSRLSRRTPTSSRRVYLQRKQTSWRAQRLV